MATKTKPRFFGYLIKKRSEKLPLYPSPYPVDWLGHRHFFLRAQRIIQHRYCVGCDRVYHGDIQQIIENVN